MTDKERKTRVRESIDKASISIANALAAVHGRPDPCECGVCWPLRQAQQKLVLAREEARSTLAFRAAWSASCGHKLFSGDKCAEMTCSNYANRRRDNE